MRLSVLLLGGGTHMVVAVLADIVEVVVLATSADALSKKSAGAP
jgi:hypothetical protein